MKLLDRIALNRLLKIITNFILGLLKIFKPANTDTIVPKPPSKKRPVVDKLKKWIDKI